MFIATTSNGATNMMSMEILSKRMAGVPFVCHQALWTEAEAPGASTNSTCFHQLFCLVNITFLTGCEQKGDQFACTFTTNVDFSAETTTTAT